MKKLFEHARDEEYQMVVQALRDDVKPEKLPKEHPGRGYIKKWERISLIDNNEYPRMVLDDYRLIVPKKMRPEILRLLHVSHSGTPKTKSTFKAKYFSPNMGKQIQQMFENCDTCREVSASKPDQTMKKDEFHFQNIEPMSHVSADLMELEGKHFLVMVDRYSSYPFFKRIRDEGTKEVTKVLTEWFSSFGYPRVLRSSWPLQEV